VSRKSVTKEYICDGIAKALREFGYPDCTAEMVGDVYDAYKTGKRFPDLPHGIIGGFAESQIKEVEDLVKVLP